MAVKLPKMMRDLVLIKYSEIDETMTKSGISLPETVVKRKSEERRMAGKEGEAVSVGKEVEEVEKGMMVTPKEYVGNVLDLGDKDNYYLVVAETDIMAYR